MNTLGPMTGYWPGSAMDQVLNRIERSTSAGDLGWPAYDLITIDKDHYRITLAVPGFKEADLEIVGEPHRLTVTGRPKTAEIDEGQVVFRGIPIEPFQRSFQLADHVRVDRAGLAEGLLHLDLVREVPEALKPKHIRINGSEEASNEQAAIS